jgi:hypothetical protein
MELKHVSKEEEQKYIDSLSISERVDIALGREFLNQTKQINITEKDVIEGYRKFKETFTVFAPHLFQSETAQTQTSY